MDEERGVAALEALEQRTAALQAGRAAERAGRQRDADRAGVEQRVDVGRVGRAQRDRAPDPERLAEREQPRVVGLQQRLGLVARQRLDPERAGDRQQRAVEAVAPQPGGARDGIVVGGVEAVLRLVAQAQDPVASASGGRAAPRAAT